MKNPLSNVQTIAGSLFGHAACPLLMKGKILKSEQLIGFQTAGQTRTFTGHVRPKPEKPDQFRIKTGSKPDREPDREPEKIGSISDEIRNGPHHPGKDETMEEFQFIHVSDLLKEFEEEQRRWIRTHRIGCVHYCKRDKCIVIDLQYGGPYWIPLNRLKTAAQCLDWIHQLHEKSWGSEVMQDFLKVLFRMIPPDFWAGKG